MIDIIIIKKKQLKDLLFRFRKENNHHTIIKREVVHDNEYSNYKFKEMNNYKERRFDIQVYDKNKKIENNNNKDYDDKDLNDNEKRKLTNTSFDDEIKEKSSYNNNRQSTILHEYEISEIDEFDENKSNDNDNYNLEINKNK